MPEPLNYWQTWAVIVPVNFAIAWLWTVHDWHKQGWPLPWEKD